MLRFDDLQLFVRAADLGSLSAAARVMDLSPAVASAALKRIEAQLGVRLLARSTRSLRLTAEGQGFLDYARTALSSLDEGRRLLARGQDQVSGVLQLSAPSDFGRNLLLPWLDAFQREHPQLTVRLLLGDRIADLFRQPVDIALRYGEPEDSSLVALPVATDNRRVLVAWAAMVVLACLLVVIWRADMDDYVKATISLILGRALGWVEQVMSFEFGLTRESAKKDDTIKNLTK